MILNCREWPPRLAAVMSNRDGDVGGAARGGVGRRPGSAAWPRSEAGIDLPGGTMEADEARIVRIIMLAVICGGIALLVFAGSVIGFGAVFVGLVGLIAPEMERGPVGPRPKTTPTNAAWTRA